MQLRLRSFHAFLQTALPAPPARVLEIGCSGGELALALLGDGYRMTAIDPEAPEGHPFRRIALEDFEADAASFDAVVASLSLHHVHDLESALAKIERVLRPGGRLVLSEFAKERVAGPTARWYHLQRQALAAVGRDDSPADDRFDRWHSAWVHNRADVHPASDLLAALARRFRQLHLGWTPYLYAYALDDSLEPAERELIETGEIEAVGFRYVGERAG
jgi:SAM-dependent methyltransferase